MNATGLSSTYNDIRQIFFEMTDKEIISKKWSNLKCILTRRSKYRLCIALSNFQLERNWFKFYLQWYQTDFFELTNIGIISKKCSSLKCILTTRSNMGHLSHWVISTWSQRFKLHVQWYLMDFLWDYWYRDNFREMFKFEMYLN